jgi:hypothetical protein
MDLETVEAIRLLKYRYLRAVDLKLWDELADTLCEDVVADYGSPSGGGPLKFESRDALVGHLSAALSGAIGTQHMVTQPEITVDGDTASGTWSMQDTVIAAEYGVVIRGGAYYVDTYRREDGVWRIASTSYKRIYETMESQQGNERFTLTDFMWKVPAS